MDPTYAPDAEAYRAKITAFLAEHLPVGFTGLGSMEAEEARAVAAEWRKTLHANRLLAASWPAEFGGGGLTELEPVILAEEFYKAGALMGTETDTFGIQKVGKLLFRL